jgi:anti-anti-sigma factor
MLFQIREEHGIVRCEGNLDIRSVEELRTLLSEWFVRNGQLTLDLSAVESCDTAGLQLLYSARQQIASHRKQMAIQAPSAVVEQTALALGIPLEALGLGVSDV